MAKYTACDETKGISVLPMIRRILEGPDLPMPVIRENQASVACGTDPSPPQRQDGLSN